MPEGFTKPNGKFTGSLGNIGIVDCHSVSGKISDNFYALAQDLNNTILYQQFAEYIKVFGDRVNETDFCQMAMTIEGVLTHAVDYYIIDNANNMKSEIVRKGRDML